MASETGDDRSAINHRNAGYVSPLTALSVASNASGNLILTCYCETAFRNSVTHTRLAQTPLFAVLRKTPSSNERCFANGQRWDFRTLVDRAALADDVRS
jgi:hypothetical protein